LTIWNRRLDVRQRETLDSSIFNGGFDVMVQAFSHHDKKEGKEMIPLSNAYGGGESFGRESIDKDGKYSWRGEVEDPSDPIMIETKR